MASAACVPVIALIDAGRRVLEGRGAGKGSSTKGNTVAVRFRHPDNETQQWTGRGRQPKWVKEWVEGGKSLDKLRV